MRKEKGITLIALVVTIVVLLILAAVTLTLVLGQNGIISKAQDGGKQYEEASKNEEEQMNLVVGEMATLTDNSKTWKDITMVAEYAMAIDNEGKVWKWDAYSTRNKNITHEEAECISNDGILTSKKMERFCTKIGYYIGQDGKIYNDSTCINDDIEELKNLKMKDALAENVFIDENNNIWMTEPTVQCINTTYPQIASITIKQTGATMDGSNIYILDTNGKLYCINNTTCVCMNDETSAPIYGKGVKEISVMWNILYIIDEEGNYYGKRVSESTYTNLLQEAGIGDKKVNCRSEYFITTTDHTLYNVEYSASIINTDILGGKKIKQFLPAQVSNYCYLLDEENRIWLIKGQRDAVLIKESDPFNIKKIISTGCKCIVLDTNGKIHEFGFFGWPV